jgi:hypothetical protein
MAGPLGPKPVEAAMTGSARRLPWSLVVLIPSTAPGGFSMRKRTLYRALAIALALAVMSPLFAASPQAAQRSALDLR